MKQLLMVLLFWTMIWQIDEATWDSMIEPAKQYHIDQMAHYYNQANVSCASWDMTWGYYEKSFLIIIDCNMSMMGRKNNQRCEYGTQNSEMPQMQ